MPDRREQVRANAQYLRNVRPVDPGEIAEYVEGQPHPGVVREDLRALAPDLGLVERADGTFAPVGEGPLARPFDGVDRLPEPYARAVEDLLVERYGAGWPDGESGDAVRETLGRLKEDYYRQHPVEYDADVALAYAVYHLAPYYAATRYVLQELVRDGLLPRHLRVLDVGAGVGGPALGLHDHALGPPGDEDAEEPPALVEYHAVEPGEAADVLDALLAETGPNFHATVHRSTAEDFDPRAVTGEGEGQGFDLLLFSNVLSELDAPADVVARYLDALAPDGTCALVAPADKHTSTTLRAVERELVDERGLAAVYAPTVRLWPGERPRDRGWSFARQPDVEPPAFQTRLAAGAPGAGRDAPDGEFLHASVQYSYALLRPDGRRRYDLALDESEVAKMAAMDRHVTERVDLVAAKLSPDLAESGNPLFKVSDGSEAVDHYAVLVRETELNGLLARAPYGALLRFENALVLWNDDEGAYNVVVDEDAVVDPA